MSGQGRIVSQLGEGMTDTETSRGAWEACLHGQNLVEACLAVVFIVELMLQFFVWGLVMVAEFRDFPKKVVDVFFDCSVEFNINIYWSLGRDLNFLAHG